MKKNILWFIAALVLFAGCLDDNNNYDYIKINKNEDYYRLLKNIKNGYNCFQGEELLFEPEVHFPLDSVNPDASYEWYVNGSMKSTEPTFRFVAEVPGVTNIVFCAIDNKTGVKFPFKINVSVISKYLKGWTILSAKEGSDESQLSFVFMREEKCSRLEYGEEVEYDTIYYIGEEKNIVPGLGFGPIKLSENFTFGSDIPNQITDEIVVLQRDKCVELNGNTFGVVAYAQDEFHGKVPVGFEPQQAVGNYACRYLLNKDGYLYFAPNTVGINLHSGRYLPDPAFGGRKIKALTRAHKVEYSQVFGIVLDAQNTFFGVIHKVGFKKDSYDFGNTEQLGMPAEIEVGNVDSSRFYNIPGEVLFTEVEEYSNYDAGYISFIHQEGNYYAHHFTLYMSRRPPIEVTSSRWSKVNSAMLSNFKDATVFHNKNYAIIANGDELWHYDFNENGDQGRMIKKFNKPIIAVSSKDINAYSDLEEFAHLGVALEGGEFYIFELHYENDEDVNSITMRKMYHNTGFGNIKDVLYKYGDSVEV